MSIATDFLKFSESQHFDIPEHMIIPDFREEFEDIKKHGHREYINSGGRGSVKSTFMGLVLMWIIKNHKNMHALVLRQVKDTLKDSVYAQLIWAINELGIADEVRLKVSPLEIEFKATGQRIYFRGADDPMSIKSIKPPFGFIGVVWFEELDQFKGDASVRSIQQSAIRGGSGAYILKSFNPPKSDINWANKYVKNPKSSMMTVHNDYRGVPPEWLGEDFIAEAEELKKTNPAAYEHEYLGIANGTGGSVFGNVKLRTITDEEIQIFDRVYRGIDWGWYPDYNRFHEVYYSKKRLYIFGEVSCRQTSNEDFKDMLLKHGLKKRQLVTCDRANEMKSISDFNRWGFNFAPAVKGPGSVETGMKWLCSLNEIIIDPVRCPMAAKEFTEYEWETNKTGEVLSGYPDKNNHSIDAVRYALERVWRR